MRVFLVGTLLAFSAVGLAFGQDTNFPNGPQYLMTSGSPLFARPIATPSLALTGPPLETGADNATGVLFAGAQNQTVLPPLAVALPSFDLFPIFYGPSQPQVIQISFAEGASQAGEFPSSIRESGVVQMTTAQALNDRGIGVTVANAAAHSKAAAGHALHIYTNADIDRLRGTS
jgi:hypothetical protein